MNKSPKGLHLALLAAGLLLPVGAAMAAQRVDAPLMLAASHESKMEEAMEVGSDTWITTKVKSALLVDRATPGMEIKVETKDGVVSLSGMVGSMAEKEAAVAKTKSVEGVREVMADGLQIAE